MSSIRVRLLVSLLALLALAAAAMAAITYRNVLGETEAIFDYQLQQMALSLRDQGEIASAQADSLADAQLDFVIQIWTIDGRTIYASRAHSSLPQRALLGLHTLIVDGNAWRTYGVATRERVIQVAQPVEIRQRLAARAAWRSVLPLLVMAPFAALAIWWLAAQNLAPLERLARELRARRARSRRCRQRTSRRGRAARERVERAPRTPA
jgi:two-component system OmpR family sensor kinase/two-component system sensor histidine kinase QseC